MLFHPYKERVTTEVIPHSSGKSLRIRRLLDSRSGRTLLVPLDHSLGDGPIASADGVRDLVETLAIGGADAVLVHKGRVRFLPTAQVGDLALVVHLNGSTRHAPDANAKVLVGEVAEAVELGADAVSVHINMGSATEAGQLTDLGRVAAECARWGVPLLAMVYPRGPRITEPTDPELVAHAANLAADLGADLVKTPYTGDVVSMAEVVRSCPIPILTAGGARVADDHQLLAVVEEVLAAGVLGLAMGRNVFESADAAKTVRLLAEAVHADRHLTSIPDQPRRPVAFG